MFDSICNVAVNKTGKKLLLYNPTELYTILYDIENENYLTIRGKTRTSVLYSFSYDDTKIISIVNNDGPIFYDIYDAHTGDILVSKYDFNGYKPISISTDPYSNKFIVNYIDGWVKAFDLSTLDELELSYEEVRNSQIPAISIYRSENKLEVICKENKVITLPHILDPINCICINQNHSIIVTGHPKGVVRIWSVN